MSIFWILTFQLSFLIFLIYFRPKENEGLKFDAYEANRLNANRLNDKEETLNNLNKNNAWGENGHIEKE